MTFTVSFEQFGGIARLGATQENEPHILPKTAS